MQVAGDNQQDHTYGGQAHPTPATIDDAGLADAAAANPFRFTQTTLPS